MSSASSQPQSGGKIIEKKRKRLSADPPYKRQSPRTSTPSPTMPTTRHSPTKAQGQDSSQVPLASIMQELALLRQSMESRFTEASNRSDSLRNEVVSKLDANDQAVSELQIAVTDVTLGVDKNQRAIHEVRAEVERREVELPGKVRAIVQEVLDRSNRPPSTGSRPRPISRQSDPPVSSSKDDSKAEAYALARRSLRFWPVSRQGDLHTRTVEFMVNELMLDQQHAVGLSFRVRRAGTGSARNRDVMGKEQAAQKVKDEVVVIFDSVRERDDIRSFAKNLEKKGRGLRLEVPDHLWPSFRVLQELAYELKQKNAKLRRNVLFDDVNQDLKMDFSQDNLEWKTVLPDEARKSLQKCRPARARRLSVSAGELEQMLGSSRPDVEMDEY